MDYPWSSVGRGYAFAPKKRPEWHVADAGLELFGLKDTTRDRRRLVERLDGRMAEEESEKCGVAEIDGQTLNSTLRRGWYWGSEQFKEAMHDELEKLAATKEKAGEAMPASNDYSASSQAKDHDSQHAEAIISRAIRHFGLQQGKGNTIRRAAYGDLSVVATAWAICRNTSVPQRWIAERLSLGSRANVSERVRRFGQMETADLTKELRKWKAMNF